MKQKREEKRLYLQVVYGNLSHTFAQIQIRNSHTHTLK